MARELDAVSDPCFHGNAELGAISHAFHHQVNATVITYIRWRNDLCVYLLLPFRFIPEPLETTKEVSVETLA